MILFFAHITQPYFLVLLSNIDCGTPCMLQLFTGRSGGQVAGWSVCVCVWEDVSHGWFWAWSAFSAVARARVSNRVVDVHIAQEKCLCRTQRASLKIRPTRLTLFGADLLVPVCLLNSSDAEVLRGGSSYCPFTRKRSLLILTSLESHFSSTLWDQRSFDLEDACWMT